MARVNMLKRMVYKFKMWRKYRKIKKGHVIY